MAREARTTRPIRMTNEQACILEELIVQAKREKSYAIQCRRIGWADDARIATVKRQQLMREARRLKLIAG